ncbi:hypothetical protein TRVA0_056S00804 [Trichomonascus vanleenenianus]|uniref:uncharacterized protein n=1 Tax=Trichomonascus vanleenenianus TaxID=2268995 RepID=UPI003EC9EFED
MQGQDMKRLPGEIWELVFDHLGVNLRKIQGVCRLFRDIAARRTWSDVNISTSNENTVHCNLGITRRNIEDAYEVFVPVASCFKKLTLELTYNAIIMDDLTPVLKAIRLALRSASEVLVVARNRTFISDPIGSALVEDFRAMGSKLTVRLKEAVSFGGGQPGPEELIATLRLLQSFGAGSIETDITVMEVGEPPRKQITEPMRSLVLATLPAPMGDIDGLLRACPRLGYFSVPTEFATSGHLVLPDHVSEFEMYDNYLRFPRPMEDFVTVSSQFITLLRVSTSVLKLSVRFDFPSLRTLELTTLRDVDADVLERLQQLTSKGLDRFVAEFGDSKYLAAIAPLVSNVREEIQLMRLGGSTYFSLQKWPKKRQYIADLINFMKYPPKARRIQLELVFFEPELMKPFLKALIEPCPRLESLRTTNYYALDIEEEEGFDCYPYMHEVLAFPGGPQFGRVCGFKTFEIDLQCIRASTQRCYGELYEIFDNIAVLREGIPGDIPNLFH